MTELDTLRFAAPGSQNARWRRLFNWASFHELNLGAAPGAGQSTPQTGLSEQDVLFTEVHDDAGRMLGGLSGVRDGDTFISGYSAPFGGVDLVDDRETNDNIADVVLGSVRNIEAAGVRSLRLKLPPACYSDNEPVVQFTLLNAGFTVERCELNQHIPVSNWRTPLEYVHALRPAAQKTLRYLLTEELTFSEVSDDALWAQAYTLLAENRLRKGRRFALSADYLTRARTQLNPHVRMFALRHGGGLVAAALVYRVAPGRDLVVAWGDAEHELKRSPMMLLAYRLVERAITDGVGVIDLGISNEPEPRLNEGGSGLVPNSGLVQFKRSVLAKIEPRLTLVKDLR
ncbi:GNAT family N-acetyltransferase [Jatrophihabitans sp. GAS493]|uniref:GNAT family N-acetyltransferase n=1 Tax=Jatrophihabitans sp. GAS493 TaxID=1907575 RepID=UPI0012FE3FE9|nr:GNAT family N-acetyltransferase [Jatrophihabitans sp. GAS493]